MSMGSYSQMNLVPVTEIPLRYQSIFQSFPYFNVVQSTVFEDISLYRDSTVVSNRALYTDKSLVVCAPTGSGKTVIFELCIIRLLILTSEQNYNPSKFKIVYMAPVKSLCNERYEDWKLKFESMGILCIQLTGDSGNEDYFELQKYSLILTTPEKWDSVTRLWKNNKVLIQMVKLLLIDEIHLLNEEERGATMEATLSRMKTIQIVLSCNSNINTSHEPGFRFVAASATFPNVQDVAEWLSTPNLKGIHYKLNDNLRPVSLRKVVIGYPYDSKCSEFKFDLMLSYKLNHVIQTYSERKPTLVFCSTRKSVIQAASILSKTAKFVVDASHKALLIDAANRMHDSALRECTLNGIGFHHGGLDVSDRRLVENMFLSSQLLVLISTSTLSMGVNFPAHLVIIKSTSQYVAGCYKDYSDTQMLQMIGRAGRPQFDTSATAVIMTKSSLQAKYESLVNGTQMIESNLHKHMAEHLNAEIALHSITDISIAMEWLKATFLYQRVFKNPKHYGMNADLSKDKIERKLQDICIKELNGLRKYQLILMDDDGFHLEPTKSGLLMAKYYLAYDTMKLFYSINGNENLAEMINLFSSCKEFDDIQLRVNEKKSLNDLNRNKLSCIRFPLQGKIKTKQMKISCLVQATFGCLNISDPSLNQDVARIFRNAGRISKCLIEYLSIENKGFAALHSAIVLSRCFKAKLWENSKFVSRQLEKIGVISANLLVNSGITTIDDILKTNPREIEIILKRNPPFGTGVVNSARQIPKYSLQVQQNCPLTRNTANVTIAVRLENISDVMEGENAHIAGGHIFIGNADNKTILFERFRNAAFCQVQTLIKKLDVTKSEKGNEINVYVISDTYVGVDIHQSYSLIYQLFDEPQNLKRKNEEQVKEHLKKSNSVNNNITSEIKMRDCNHKCAKKNSCSHSCCKIGVAITIPKKSHVSNFMDELQNRINDTSNKVKVGVGKFSENFKKFENNYSISTILVNSEVTPKEKCMSLQQKNMTEESKHSYSDIHISQYDESTEEADLNFNSYEEESENLSFDVNFETDYTKNKLQNSIEPLKQDVKQAESMPKFYLFPENHPNAKCRVEKWEDEEAAEETFNMCLKFLSNQTII